MLQKPSESWADGCVSAREECEADVWFDSPFPFYRAVLRLLPQAHLTPLQAPFVILSSLAPRVEIFPKNDLLFNVTDFHKLSNRPLESKAEMLYDLEKHY